MLAQLMSVQGAICREVADVRLATRVMAQRDALRSVWRWYLLPLVPGLAAVLLVTGMERGFDVRIVLLALAFAAVFGGVWLLNQWGARKLDRKVEELRVLETDGE